MAGITTNMATSFKQEILSGGHCFNQTVTPTVTAVSNSTSLTSVSSTAGVAVGMTVTGTGTTATTTVARITGASTLTLSAPTTAIISAAALTFAGDVFKIALAIATPAGTFTTTSVNYADLGTDELATATGYTRPGVALTNVSATTGSTTAYVTFSPDPSWTSATFSTSGCMIYNSSIRNGGTSGTDATGGGGRCCGVFSFGGVQNVTGGTFTVLMPTAASTTAVLRIQ